MARALCSQSNWVVCQRWWNWVPLACYMLGSSVHTTENPTANHSGVPCWERCHVPRTLKIPAEIFYRSRSPCAPPQEAELPDHTHISLFPVAIIFLSCYLCIQSHFSFLHNFMFILSSISCSSPGYSEILLLGR